VPERIPAVEAFWAAYRAASGLDHDRYDVVAHGHTPAIADSLAALILAGRKRATASLDRDYGPGRAPRPAPGDHVLVVDGSGRPACIWQTTEVTVGPYTAVTEDFAWVEGEGDRSRATWLANHRTYFEWQAKRDGFVLTDDEPAVFERFRVVWPAPDA
jgi:uncharacterized protein YhfF